MPYASRVEEVSKGAQAGTEMPRYQCHKKVWALKIASIEKLLPTIEVIDNLLAGDPRADPVVGAVITPADEGYGPFLVESAYVRKHDPQAGGYFVVYEGGYKSYSPAKAFEEGYTKL